MTRERYSKRESEGAGRDGEWRDSRPINVPAINLITFALRILFSLLILISRLTLIIIINGGGGEGGSVQDVTRYEK